MSEQATGTTAMAEPETRRMGATPLADGVFFKVWAPNASGAAVVGSFNEWRADATPLSPDGGGRWSALVPGAKVGDEYQFVITHRDSGEALWRRDPYGREMVSSSGNSVVAAADFAWSAEGFEMPSWNTAVIYELHVGTFSSDPHQAQGRGTFDSLIGKLDYLRDLGINAIEVMAAGEFPTDVSWGYNQSYMFSIESSYGGQEAFKRFVDAAHQHGIAVICDVVFNHIGPSDLDLWRFDGWSEGEGGGIYFYNDARGETPWGHTRPDYGRPEVREYLHDNAFHWLDELRVDGLRWDATNFIRAVDGKDGGQELPEGWSLMQWINGEIRARQPWKLSIAEDLQTNDALTEPVESGGAGFSAQWEGAFPCILREVLVPPEDTSRNLDALVGLLTRRTGADALGRVVYTESHDEVANGKCRVPEEIAPGAAASFFARKRAMLGSALVLTSPGIPMLFQGQEFLEDGCFEDTRLLDWGKVERHGQVLDFHRALIRLRRNLDNTTRGLTGQHIEVFHVNQEAKVLAFRRWDQGGAGDDVVVVVNLSNQAFGDYGLGVPRPGRWHVRLNSDWEGFGSDFANTASLDFDAEEGEMDGQPAHGRVALGPYTTLILSQ